MASFQAVKSTPLKTDSPPSVKAEASKESVITVRASHGEMVDAYTGVRIGGQPVQVVKNGWIDVQLEAKKLEIVNG